MRMDTKTARDSGLPPSPHGLPAGFGGASGTRDSRLRHTACRPASAGQAGLGSRKGGGEGREAIRERQDVRIAARLLLSAAVAAFGVSLQASAAVAQPAAVTRQAGAARAYVLDRRA